MHKTVTEKTHMYAFNIMENKRIKDALQIDMGDHANRASMYRRTSVLKRLKCIVHRNIDKCATMFFNQKNFAEKRVL